MNAEIGDKVRLRGDDHPGQRGIVEAVEGGKLAVRLEGSGQRTWLTPEQVTNFSLAARKAWVTDPHRRVGRPKGTRLYDRVSVTLRIDRELWEQFRAMEKAGRIENRTGVVNRWLRQKMDELDAGERGS
jgi:hypothetical protein